MASPTSTSSPRRTAPSAKPSSGCSRRRRGSPPITFRLSSRATSGRSARAPSLCGACRPTAPCAGPRSSSPTSRGGRGTMSSSPSRSCCPTTRCRRGATLRISTWRASWPTSRAPRCARSSRCRSARSWSATRRSAGPSSTCKRTRASAPSRGGSTRSARVGSPSWSTAPPGRSWSTSPSSRRRARSASPTPGASTPTTSATPS
mmetsp:Transcript_35046/g.89549  ORF Transcript_35046/g.89549 Transcript_35046/m.89549 type:complete len:204 (-) Transcript_35046:435-1046(-)